MSDSPFSPVPPAPPAPPALPVLPPAPPALPADPPIAAAEPAGEAPADTPGGDDALHDLDTAPAVTEPVEATPSAPAPARTELSPAACANLLKQHFPALFGGPPRPLKLRIQIDIHERAPGVFTKAALSGFFRRYTTSTAYLLALGKAASRFDLDGQPSGELSEEHRQLAREELTRRRQITREREQQAQAQERAQAQAQHAEAAERQRAEQQERQARLTLLRDFERTTLTMANFCVLKGLKPEALTPLLDQARKEAAEAPPVPRADERRGPPGPRRDGPRQDGPRQDRPRQDSPRQDGPRQDGPRPDGPRRDRPAADGRPQHRPAAGPPRGDRRGGKPPGPRQG